MMKNTPPKKFKAPHLLSGLDKSSPLLIGLSGGADSTALLHMLWIYCKEAKAPLYAAHVNHGIRGEEADRDEEFCHRLCQSLDIPLLTLHADVPSLAKERGESIETAARNVRYEYFDSLMEKYDIPLLATAHNANDNLETMLFNIARGTSLTGACGIPETRRTKHGSVIRPILSMSKDEIYAYCKENGLSFVTDSTNTDTDYTRNKIRQEIIPLLCQINKEAVANASRLSASLRADALCLESMRDMFMEELCQDCSVEAEKISGSPEAIASRVLVSLYGRISEVSLEYTHIEALRALAAKAVPHSRISLHGGIEAVIEDGWLIFRKQEEPCKTESYELPLNEGYNKASQTNCEIIIESSQNTKNIYKKSILLTLDFDKISGSLYARERRSGDKLLLGGMHKSVKKLMCDKKLPLRLRSRLPVICDENGIVAIPLIGIRDGVKANDKTKSKCFLYVRMVENE